MQHRNNGLHSSYQKSIQDKSLFDDGMVEFSLITNGQEHRRNTAIGCKADYYRNLNRHGFFSCRSREGIHKGKVTCYANMFVVLNPTFVVSSASRNRVIVNNKRNVHAFVRSSSLIDAFNGDLDLHALPSHDVITYQPFVRDCFFNRDTNIAISEHKGIAILFGANVYCLTE